MKSPVVRLKIRIRLPDGSRPYLDPVPSGNGKLKPLYALVDGKPEHHPEGCYFLRYANAEGKRVWERVGKDGQFALGARLKRERSGAAEAVGVGIVHDTDKRLLSKAIAEYNAEIKAHKSKRTHAAYRLTLSLFQDAIKTTYLEDISREDILTFISALRDDECGPRTVSNRVRYLSSFLKHFKLNPPPGEEGQAQVHPEARPGLQTRRSQDVVRRSHAGGGRTVSLLSLHRVPRRRGSARGVGRSRLRAEDVLR